MTANPGTGLSSVTVNVLVCKTEFIRSSFGIALGLNLWR